MAESNLILILGDQLSLEISSLKAADKARDRVLLVEVMEEATYVRHHKKKIAFLFSAMRHFAAELEEAGWQVDYVRIDAEENSGSFTGEAERFVERQDPAKVIVTEPGEWRVLEAMKAWPDKLGRPVDILTDGRFICCRAEFETWADGRKQLRMEYFYREMRRKTGLLMAGDEPEGGKWNYDAENRKPASSDLFMPKPLRFEPDEITREVLATVEGRFSDHFGDLEPFCFAVTRKQAEKVLAHFIEVGLARFGDYQDAMLTDEPFLYHSLLSFYLNAGLLDPLHVCRKVEKSYLDGEAPLNAAEGFIRQIIGWREYVRGIYWLKMPGYERENFFENTRNLPEFYWTGDTGMACLRAAIGQTRKEAYAHHIQRLMVTGNFALLAGIDPHQVHEWYLAVYADAYEWVELPNTLGMSQFADGGLLGSKPYAASGNYINKMSDYCQTCRYDVKRKTGEGACPFNALYWDFLVRNREKLQDNPRLRQVYSTWQKMKPDKRREYLDSAGHFLKSLK
ncbi:cryptochrome/photolyase family protein [Maricaulis maris]|uniref:cryptochrome/photolyase family protein n=1 Tax=Maricaulis maris TaxID=74318 RepID=UPI003A8F264E